MRDAPGFDGIKPSRKAASVMRFAGLVHDLDACTLARDSGEAIPLTRGEFALLRMFVTRPGRVISRDTLLDAFTNRRFEPFDRSIDVMVGRLRKKMEADPKRPRLIVTVPGEGYRFDGLTQSLPSEQKPSIAVLASQDGALSDRDQFAKPSPAARQPGGMKSPMLDRREPPRLSIVVLPFTNIGGDPEQEFLIDGVTESLTTDLSRVRGAIVIARNTAFTYKDKTLELKTIGRELNVRYVLKGSVQRSENRMRVNVHLVDAATSNHLWSERFDKPLASLFDMQDEIVSRLAGALNTELPAAEARRAEKASNPDSMDFYFQGLAWLNKGVSPDNVVRARGFFARALAADPGNIEALVGSGFVDLIEAALAFVADPIATFAAAEAKLTRALSSVPDHALGHTWLGLVHILTKRAHEGIAGCEHALELDRNLAHAHASIGQGKIFIGRAEETEAHVAEALRLSPRDTWAYAWMNMVGLAKLHLGSCTQAAAWFRRSKEANRNFASPYFNIAASLAQLGGLHEAGSNVKAGLLLNPTYTVFRVRADWRARSDDPTYLAQLEPIFEGLRQAGVPER
jgi:TolB-like protein/DNA-binding winged helix-turn-helix (wHTH) protein